MTTTEETQRVTLPPASGRPPQHTLWLTVIMAALVGAVATAWVADLTGATRVVELAGLQSADAAVLQSYTMSKYVYDAFSLATVGILIAAAVFMPGNEKDRRRLTPQAWKWSHAAAWLAAGWAVTALARVVIGYAYTFTIGFDEVTLNGAISYLTDSSEGQSLGWTALLAAATAIIAARALTVGGVFWAAGFAVVSILPPVFTGHSAANGNHQIALDGLILHILASAVWTGGLIALLIARNDITTAARRYSTAAAYCFAFVAFGGLVTFFANTSSLTSLWTTAYGYVALAKLGVLAALGVVGWLHRRHTLPKLPNRAAFVRLASVELVIFGAVVGLAAALATTPPPATEYADPSVASLGFPVPPEFSVANVLKLWYPSILFCTAAVLLTGLYIAGVRRLRKKGQTWPWSRTALWIAGWSVVVLATSTGMGKYGLVMFSAHMVQHMMLNMLAPILLVLAAPVTLALRALPVDKRGGPREWLLAVVHSRFSRILSQPLVALAVYVSSLYVMYFSGIFEWAMGSHFGHLAMSAHFLLAGCLFFWVVIGPDPKPRQLSYPAKTLLYFVSLIFHAIFGITLMMGTTVIAENWYNGLEVPWLADRLNDQQTGGGIAWGFGEIPSVIVIGFLIAQWSKSDEREGRKLDRMADRAAESGHPEDDPHERYNEYLAKLNSEGK
ncbi:cytochrome c oxidase assembly protein [Salininema proteolyticum]|uniref:Cytochrome c oxidase assembly protein n=1 Tax=Salininema proteolyticum TaxID=1607685 RepID=A0ABV8TVI0_9ACTN